MLATNTGTCDDFGHRFDSVCFRQSTLIRHVCVFVSTHFQERFQIGDAFSMKTLSVLVWTEGLNASKCMRFQWKTH